MNKPIMKKPGYGKFLLYLLGGILFLCSICLIILGNSEDTTRTLIQWTAKISTILFAIAFGVSAFHYFFKDKHSSFVLKHRAYFGLAFGAFHTVHLITLLWLQYFFHPVFNMAKHISLLGGGLAYLFMFAMVMTTFSTFKSKMSTRSWRWLHLVGGYWIWFIFFRTYLARVMDGGYGYFLLVFLILAILLRIVHYFSMQRKVQ